MKTDVLMELKALRLQGMAGAWADLVEQGGQTGIESSRWLEGFDTRYRIAADYDSVLRFLAVGKIRTAYIPQVLVRMRAGGISNRSLMSIIRKSREDLDVLRRNKVGGILTLLRKNVSKLSQFWKR